MKSHTWSPSVRPLPCVSAVLLFAVLVIANGQEPSSPKLKEEPSIKRLYPKEPHDAAKTFSVLHGFRMELIAHEPLLRDPVSIAYDENGAMYVVEMTAYPPSGPAKLGRVPQAQDAKPSTSNIIPSRRTQPPFPIPEAIESANRPVSPRNTNGTNSISIGPPFRPNRSEPGSCAYIRVSHPLSCETKY